MKLTQAIILNILPLFSRLCVPLAKFSGAKVIMKAPFFSRKKRIFINISFFYSD
jgi:hypothetical protein